jgi:Protein of unknown function (DUF3040)
VLSDHDRRTLEEIERHLQDDPALLRTFDRRLPAGRGSRACRRWWRATSGIRRVWFVLLAVALVLTVATAALHASGAAVESALVAVVIGIALRSTATTVGPGAGRGPMPDRRW